MELTEFIERSPTAFHAVSLISRLLASAGFVRLYENEKWDIAAGGKYYVIRNSSSVIAFCVGSDYRFHIIASHSDSPCFRLKHSPELRSGAYLRLNCEAYGGMNVGSWFDRPLALAGRVMIDNNGSVEEKLIRTGGGTVVIPSVAIHLDRDLNNGKKLDRQNDVSPVFASLAGGKSFLSLLAGETGARQEDILSSEISLVNSCRPFVWGADGEFISAWRLDDLQCAYASLEGILSCESRGISVYCCFDNEEVGSLTPQGARSSFLSDVLERINIAMNKSREEYLIALSSSFILSADNAHAVHPAHPELTDGVNKCEMNGGVVIKVSSSRSYMTDASTFAFVSCLARENGIPYQVFHNHSNVPGGGTLGNMLGSCTGIRGADIGLAQLSMHSATETAGTRDTEYLVRLSKCFYER